MPQSPLTSDSEGESITRGQDAGFHPAYTGQNRYGFEFDGGFNAGFLYYTGDTWNLSKEHLYGPTQTLSGGFGVGGNVTIGSDTRGRPILWGGSLGVGTTLGISYGQGETVESIEDYHAKPF